MRLQQPNCEVVRELGKLAAELTEQKERNQEHTAALQQQTAAIRELLETFTTASEKLLSRRELVH